MKSTAVTLLLALAVLCSFSATSVSGHPYFCTLPPDPGHCTGHFHRYYFNQWTGTCQVFHYTGCGGNQNRFFSYHHCHSVCHLH